MEYQNIVIFILIFIVLMTIFYFVISNFGISNVSSEPNTNIKELEKKVSNLTNELVNLKISQITHVPSESNIIKEIIIETPEPTITTRSNNLSSNNLSDNNLSDNNLGGNNLDSNLILPSQSNQTKLPPIIYDPIANYDVAKLTDPLVDPRGRTSADQIPTPQVAAQFNFPTQGVLDRYHRVGLLIAIGSNKKDDIKFKSTRSPNRSYDKSSGEQNVWEGHIRQSKPKKVRRYIPPETNSQTKSYRGIDIKENFDSDDSNDSNDYYDSDSDSDSIEEFTSTQSTNKNKIINVYNNYSDLNDNSILELIGKKITDNWYKYFTSITMGNKIIKVVIRNNNRRELYTGDIVFVPEIGKSYRVKIDPMDMIEYNPYMF
jgi:hypothetical protein